jgi:hypothetical protein
MKVPEKCIPEQIISRKQKNWRSDNCLKKVEITRKNTFTLNNSTHKSIEKYINDKLLNKSKDLNTFPDSAKLQKKFEPPLPKSKLNENNNLKIVKKGVTPAHVPVNEENKIIFNESPIVRNSSSKNNIFGGDDEIIVENKSPVNLVRLENIKNSIIDLLNETKDKEYIINELKAVYKNVQISSKQKFILNEDEREPTEISDITNYAIDNLNCSNVLTNTYTKSHSKSILTNYSNNNNNNGVNQSYQLEINLLKNENKLLKSKLEEISKKYKSICTENEKLNKKSLNKSVSEQKNIEKKFYSQMQNNIDKFKNSLNKSKSNAKLGTYNNNYNFPPNPLPNKNCPTPTPYIKIMPHKNNIKISSPIREETLLSLSVSLEGLLTEEAKNVYHLPKKFISPNIVNKQNTNIIPKLSLNNEVRNMDGIFYLIY